ncbi:MAG: hypothetical protein HY744_07150 [Deltaproteobacteria bacterium]|nr:hypothetical protein [Deltaproteobacteria bacterium]
MVSSTKQTWRLRERRRSNAGKRRKRQMRVHGTPAFPIHPPGYDPSAPDAKRPAREKDE